MGTTQQNSREDQLKEEIHRLELDQERTLTELHFKKEKIDDFIASQREMREELRKLNDTVSKLYSRTIEHDSELRERISKVESQIVPRDEIFREDIPERVSSVEATLLYHLSLKKQAICLLISKIRRQWIK